MCGIVGYTGSRPVTDILMEGLSRLEYRGYDSAGIAVEQDGKLEVVHCKGKVSGLADAGGPARPDGHLRHRPHALGHARPSFRGERASPRFLRRRMSPSSTTASSRTTPNLREELEGRGHAFTSETDTEVIAHLVEEAYEGDRDLLQRRARGDGAPHRRLCARRGLRPGAGHHRGGAQGLALRGGPGRKTAPTWPATSSP